MTNVIPIGREPYIRLRTRPGSGPSDQSIEPTTQASEPVYEVGYGRPPARTQFKPGKSGNPKGRPKGSKSLGTIVRQVTDQKVTIRTPRGVKKVTAMEAILQRLLEQAFKGDHRAIVQLFSLRRSIVRDNEPDQPSATSAELSATDAAILAEYEALIRGQKDQLGGEDA